jgi:hypothetical protein
VIDPEMPINPDIHLDVIAPPAIRMDNAVGLDVVLNDGLQRGFGCIQDDLGVGAVTALEQTKDDRFAACSTCTFATNSFGVKVGLIGLKLAFKGLLSSTSLGHTNTDSLVYGVRAANRKPSQFNCIGSRQIHGKQTYNLSKLGFADFRTAVIPVFRNHF